MAEKNEMALKVVKQRLNRLPGDTTLDTYLQARVDAAAQELERAGIQLDPNAPDDLMLLVDLIVWRYQSRDVAGSTPNWLQQAIRWRWLQQRQVNTDDS